MADELSTRKEIIISLRKDGISRITSLRNWLIILESSLRASIEIGDKKVFPADGCEELLKRAQTICTSISESNGAALVRTVAKNSTSELDTFVRTQTVWDITHQEDRAKILKRLVGEIPGYGLREIEEISYEGLAKFGCISGLPDEIRHRLLSALTVKDVLSVDQAIRFYRGKKTDTQS